MTSSRKRSNRPPACSANSTSTAGSPSPGKARSAATRPCLFLAPGPVTWHSAFLVCRDGRTRAIVGRYDQKAIEETGAYDKVVGFVTGFKEPLLEFLREADPRTIAVNFSQDSEICDGLTHGMYLTLHGFLAEIGMADRLVSAEKLVSALRERKSAAEIGWIKQAVRATEEIFDLVGPLHRPGPDRERDRRLHPGRGGPPRPADGLGPGDLPGRLHRPRHGPGPLFADRPDGRAGPRPQHGLRRQGRRLLLGHAEDVLRPGAGRKDGPRRRQKGFGTIVRAVEESKRAMKPGVEGRTSTPSPARSSSQPATTSFPTPSATRSAASPTTGRPCSARPGRSTPGSRSGRSRRAWSSPSSRA